MDVVLLRWPDDAPRRSALMAAGQPRLLLVAEGTDPPIPDGCLEDWLRVPASDADVQARVAALVARTETHRPAQPLLEDEGVLRMGPRWVPLAPVEARLARPLVERFGAVVGRETLARAGWPDGSPGRNVLDVHVLRLRRRVAQLDLAIRTVRSRGYLLERATAVSASG